MSKRSHNPVMLTHQQVWRVGCLAALLLASLAVGSPQEVDTPGVNKVRVLSPQALHRKSYFKFDPGMLVKMQRADAAVEHRLPADFTACCSLEGPACLSSEKPYQEGALPHCLSSAHDWKCERQAKSAGGLATSSCKQAAQLCSRSLCQSIKVAVFYCGCDVYSSVGGHVGAATSATMYRSPT